MEIYVPTGHVPAGFMLEITTYLSGPGTSIKLIQFFSYKAAKRKPVVAFILFKLVYPSACCIN